MRPFLAVLLVSAACQAAPTPSPYAGQTESPVRGLTAQEVADLLAGRGAGYARTAELNSYPGPRHVLDFGARLDLTPAQHAQMQAIFDRMQREAQRLGADIVARERALSEAFAGRNLSAPDLDAAVDTLGALYARLRATHLRAHLEATALLSPDQIRAYDRLRGYGDSTHPGSHDHPTT
jgi:Spy/CpxP family protein refolding chaperone